MGLNFLAKLGANVTLIRNVIKLDLILVSSKLLYLNLFKNKL